MHPGQPCFQFWPPVKVTSAKKLSGAHGVKGKLAVWHRNGFMQLTLGGHPLYTYAGDSKRHVATGEGIKGFNGTWHVVKASPAHSGGTPTTTTSTTTTTYHHDLAVPTRVLTRASGAGRRSVAVEGAELGPSRA